MREEDGSAVALTDGRVAKSRREGSGPRRINLRGYPRSLQGVAVSRAQLEAVYRLLEVRLDMKNLYRRPLIDALAEAFMLGVNGAVAHIPADPGRPVPPHGSGP